MMTWGELLHLLSVIAVALLGGYLGGWLHKKLKKKRDERG